MKKQLIRKLTLIIISLAMLAGCLIVSGFDYLRDPSGEQPEIGTVDVEFTAVMKEEGHWNFPYDDSLFDLPDNQYNHKFAQMSLGMTVAAFRASYLENPDQDANIRDYFKKIGFTDLEDISYRSKPTTSSIASAIAHKKMNGYTVIAVAVCGQGYEKEWCSNLNIGTGDIHLGFNSAAKLVEARLDKYIEKYELSGDLVIWTSGFSRAAAVSNVLAADLTDTGRFSKVFAYSFATPATNRDSRYYDNIFCIIGKDDPVPMIPFIDWGYSQYGLQLYLNSPEANSTYTKHLPEAEAVYEQILGRKLAANPELTLQMRTLFTYLHALVPDPETYVEKLQPYVMAYFDNTSSDGIFDAIVNIMNNFVPETKEEEETLNSLLLFVELMANQYIFQGNDAQKESGAWDNTISTALNLFSTHNPSVYIAWMFSTDDYGDIFSVTRNYGIITVRGDVKAYIFDMYGCVAGFDQKGPIHDEVTGMERLNNEPKPEIYYQYKEGQLVTCFPEDWSYSLLLEGESDKEEQLEIYVSLVTDGSIDIFVEKAMSAEVSSDNFVSIYYTDTDFGWEIYASDNESVGELIKTAKGLSPDFLMKLQNINFMHLSLGEIIMLVIALVIIFTVLILISAILGIIRLARHKQRRMVPAIISHVFAAMILMAVEMLMWYFVPAVIWARLAFQFLSYVMIILLALKGLKVNKTKKSKIMVCCIAGVMILACILEPMLVGKIAGWKAAVTLVVDIVLIVASCMVWKKDKTNVEPPSADLSLSAS